MAAGLLPFTQGVSLLTQLLVPAVVLVCVGQNPLAYARLGRWRAVLPFFGFCLLGVTIGGLWIAQLAEVRTYYATALDPGATSVAGLLAALVCGEFFFRGVLVLALFPRFGCYAVLGAAAAYGLIHVGKPAVELIGSVPFALALSHLALRSGSILYGIALHVVLALGVPSLIQLSSG